MVAADPTKGVKLLAGANDADGFYVWTQQELDRFEARWPVGTRERLAFDLLLYTGLRRGDAVRVGRQHEREGWLTIRTEKHRKGKPGEQVAIPILEPLAASLAATKTGDLTYLVTEHGQPWVKESFGNWFREACRKAGCRAQRTACVKPARPVPQSAGRPKDNSWLSSDGPPARWRNTTRGLLIARGLRVTLPNCCCRINRRTKKVPHLIPDEGASENMCKQSGG